MSFMKRLTSILLLGTGAMAILIATLIAFPGPTQATSLAQSGSEGKQIFDSKCAACHTIGGGHLIGPDLQDVTLRRDLAWLKGFISAPDKVIASGDPIATQLLQENNNVQMPNLGLSQAQVDSVVAYLESPDQANQTDAAPAQAAQLPAGDAQRGMALFTGDQPLANGGPACIACHTLNGAVALGGGTLGPDLTQVFQRYGDAGLASALNTIPFPTMQGVFLNQPLTPQEQANLHVLFTWTQNNAPAPAPTNSYTPWFIAGGGLGAILLFGVMAFFWPRQRQSLAERLRNGQR